MAVSPEPTSAAILAEVAAAIAAGRPPRASGPGIRPAALGMVPVPQAQDHPRNRAMLQTVSPAQAGAVEPLPSATETKTTCTHPTKRAPARQRATPQSTL